LQLENFLIGFNKKELLKELKRMLLVSLAKTKSNLTQISAQLSLAFPVFRTQIN